MDGGESSYSIYKVGETNEDVSGEVTEGKWLSMKKKDKNRKIIPLIVVCLLFACLTIEQLR